MHCDTHKDTELVTLCMCEGRCSCRLVCEDCLHDDEVREHTAEGFLEQAARDLLTALAQGKTYVWEERKALWYALYYKTGDGGVLS